MKKLPIIILALLLAGCPKQTPTPNADQPEAALKGALKAPVKRALKSGTGPLDFTIVTSGGHHVTAGHYMFFNVTGMVISGSDENVVPTITGLPAGATAMFVNMVNPAFCCGTFLWSINDTTPVRLDVTGVVPGTYAATITYTSKTSSTVRGTTFPFMVDPVPIPSTAPLTFPPDVPLAGQTQWEANMKTFGLKHCTVPAEGPAWEGNGWYYDGTRVMYQIADYTKDPSWNKCAADLDALYAPYVLTNPGGIQGYHVFPLGLAMSFLRTGNVQDKTALLSLLNNGYANYQNLTPSNADPLNSWMLSREMAYAADTLFASMLIGTPQHPNFQNVIELLFGHFDQWFLTQNAPYVQPFMVALASEPMMAYYDLTKDPRVIPLLQLAADHLWSDSWNAASNGFLYYNYNAALGPPPPRPYPFDPKCPNYPSFTFTCEGPSQDLNLLIASLFGWVYQHTGILKYRTEGDTIFNSGVSGAWLIGGKQFSQNYRWSDKYVAWRKRPVTQVKLNCVPNVVLNSGVQLTCKVQ